MATKAIELRRGQAVNYKGGVWVCVTNEKIAKGKGQSYQSVSLKNIKTGQLISERFRTTEELEQAIVNRKKLEYLYSDADSHILMDGETFEQTPIPAELVGDGAVYLSENLPIEVSFVEGQAVTAELPNTVELKVIDTPPQIKGATATNQLKDAACQGGAVVKVPPFVEKGTVIKVDTRTGEYISKA